MENKIKGINQTAGEMFGLSNILIDLLCDARAREQQEKLLLEVEESGKLIAACQGEIAGIRQMITFMIEAALFSEVFLHTIDKPEFMAEPHSLPEEELMEFYAEIREIKESSQYKTFDRKVSEEIEEKKNYLFYRAEKGRDIDFVHGYRDGILRIRGKITTIVHEKENREKEMPLFGRPTLV